MDASLSLPGSPVGGPLQAITPERVNQRRESIFNTPLRPESRDSSVHEKISQFNNLSASIQSRHLERKTADAALKRAMLGREEAESEMRKAREEIRALRSALEEGKDRERKVGERLETVMVSITRSSSRGNDLRLLTTPTGELWPRQRNTRTHAGSLGERNSTSKKRKLQDPIKYG